MDMRMVFQLILTVLVLMIFWIESIKVQLYLIFRLIHISFMAQHFG